METSFMGNPAFNALLAYESADMFGVLVWSPLFSTTRGGGGLFVSDLWVASSARGQGTGRKLLAHAISDAEDSSGACFVRLAAHRNNPSACSYYAHIGFDEEADMLSMLLEGSALQYFKEI
ncbi:GNAT family N-acetyltransferase [Roseovarius aestuarii]|uniref:GNAT family N-acetyltransferase n=1 Tax=Roseovarius aestuarii TaxID=475083 RepID=UPI001CC0408C